MEKHKLTGLLGPRHGSLSSSNLGMSQRGGFPRPDLRTSNDHSRMSVPYFIHEMHYTTVPFDTDNPRNLLGRFNRTLARGHLTALKPRVPS